MTTYLRLAGCFDLLYLYKDKYYLYDWKTCKKISMTSEEKMQEPFDSLYDCNYTKYCIQLCIYRYILETKYGLSNIICKIIMISDTVVEYDVDENIYELIKTIFNNKLKLISQ
jgi:ATP-dependent exoDNAse (exonuclease V) beta subunit